MSGGGNEKQSFPLDKFFLQNLPPDSRFLYIPIALRGHKLFLSAHLWIKNIFKLHKRTDIQLEIVNHPSRYKQKDLIIYDCIYIGGGNTWSLIQELKNSSFSDSLIQYFKSGGKIYGGSAGAIILGKKINTQKDENRIKSKDISGLDLLNGFSVACHFKESQNERFELWSKKNKLPIFCLPEETGLIINKDTALCVGDKPCTIFYPNGEKIIIKPKNTFNLK